LSPKPAFCLNEGPLPVKYNSERVRPDGLELVFLLSQGYGLQLGVNCAVPLELSLGGEVVGPQKSQPVRQLEIDPWWENFWTK
jgi:hypothetical protein